MASVKNTTTIAAIESFSVAPRVLVVENDKANAFVISTILDLLGYEYDLVGSGEKAVEAVKRHEYTTVLMDIVLDGICGIQATKSIRAYEMSKELPPVHVIGTSTQSCSEIKDYCMNAGINDYFCKPYQLKVISDRLTSQ